LTSYLPGIDADNVDIQVTRESVLITGQRQRQELPEGHRALYSNVRYGQFRRLVELPYEVQNGNVKASFDDGVLTLTLPKVEEEKNKVVKLSLTKTAESVG
ncbi:MAG: Hsp20/alpha crystallin family protein, partial [Cyanobacteria bacterium P01_F01_bin.42]